MSMPQVVEGSVKQEQCLNFFLLPPLYMSALRSITTGKVFESSAADISLGIVPTVPLPQDHPFCVLLEEHMTAVTKPGTYDALIDAYIAISKGDPHWRQKARVSIGDIVAERRNMRKLLRQNPPDVIIVDQDPSKGYGFHERTPSMWSFICITKHYVDRWMAEEGLIKLGLEAVFKAAREHENGHWLFTLVRHIRKPLVSLTDIWLQRAGYFSQVHLDADNLSSPEREIELAKISSQSPEGHKHIPKLLQACWNEDNREAGDWSEVQGRGGIIGFNNSFNIGSSQRLDFV
jgi:hypothetical protein